MFLKGRTLKDVFIHVFIMILAFVAIIIIFFYYYLPSSTKHGETIEVPKLTGMNVEELQTFLDSKNLRYQINDSSYSPNIKASTVLSQHPLPGTHVKENRMLYISVSSKNPPKVKMPKLVDGSLKSAEIALRGAGLELGNIKYVPSPFSNLVIDQLMNDKPVAHGSSIPKGSKIDLMVGNGSQSGSVEIPDVLGKDIEEAKNILIEKGLTVGLIKSDANSTQAPGIILIQAPSAGTTGPIGSSVDLTISETKE